MLREVPLIAAEDTRVALDLLRAHGLSTRLVSCFEHNEEERVPQLVAHLRGGADLALLSDAGTPLIRDPGYRVVRACLDAGIPIDVLPGPCAAIAALVGSGLPPDRFHFLGFLPVKAGERDAALAEVAGLRGSLVLYESPRRAGELLVLLASVWPDRQLCVARNLTKTHEQWIRGTAAECLAVLGEEDRGEVTIVVAGAAEAPVDDTAVTREIQRLLEAGVDPRSVRDRVAAWSGRPRREVYARVLAARQPEGGRGGEATEG